MIVDHLLDWWFGALNWIVGLFPSEGSSGLDAIPGAWEQVLGYLDDLNYFLPIAETFVVVLGVFLVFPLLMGVTLSLWVLAQIRGSSSRG